MTTAHRPTLKAAVAGGERGNYKLFNGTDQRRVRSLPSHMTLKLRKPGQGAQDDLAERDLRAELEEREEVKKIDHSMHLPPTVEIEKAPTVEADRDDTDDSASSESDSDSSDSSEDETAQLMRELERIKKERAQEAERRKEEDLMRAAREGTDASLRSNPLLDEQGGGGGSATLKRRWYDETVFKNQAADEPKKQKKRFVNDSLRSDFHRMFMDKYIK